MRSKLVSFSLLMLLGFAGLATATIVGDLLTQGIDTTGSNLHLNYSSIVIEGDTSDAHETTLSFTDPTGDATITIPNTTQTLGTATTISDDPTFSGSLAYNVLTITNATDGDNIDVSGVNVLAVDTTNAAVVIGGFSGGVAGQDLSIYMTATNNTMTVENEESVGAGNQTIYLASGIDEVYGSWNGLHLVCDGSAWYEDDGIAADVLTKAQFADEDWGDVSVSSNSVTLDADVVAAAEMANADHGDVSWSSGVASVEAVDDDVALDGSLQFNTTTVTDAGPTDDLDASGLNVVFIDTSSNNVTLGGATGGVAGQMLKVVIIDATNNATIEHQELSGSGQFNLVDAGDQTIAASFGGWEFVSNGTQWFELDHD